MRKIHRRVATGLLAGAAISPWAIARAQEPLKVGFVYVGPVSDHGWTYQHDQGRIALQQALGDKVSTRYIENVSEGPDAARVIQSLVSSGDDLIYTTSFGFMDPTIEVAEKFPDKYFEQGTGYKTSRNVSTYNARYYEGRYVCGVIAGKMSKTGTIGYIAAFPVPEVVRGINAFTLGLRKINPEASVRVIWVNTWYDPAKEADAARALMDQGADVLAQHTDSTAMLLEAEKRGVLGFGQASDMYDLAPKAQLTSIVNNWSDYYIARTQAVLDGTWTSRQTWGGLDLGMIKMAPYTNMPESVSALARKTAEDIRSGALHPFTGPITRQDGEQILSAGETFQDADLQSMNYYVSGVRGSFPS